MQGLWFIPCVLSFPFCLAQDFSSTLASSSQVGCLPHAHSCWADCTSQATSRTPPCAGDMSVSP